MPLECIDIAPDSVENCPIGIEPGIFDDVYVAVRTHLTSAPKPIARTGTTTAANWNTTTGSFVFEQGKSFSKLQCTDSPKYTDKIEGESGSRGVKGTLEVMLQRSPAAIGFRGKHKNAALIVVYKDGDGRWCQLGYIGRTAKVVAGDSELSAAKASIMLQFEAPVEQLYLPDNFDPDNLGGN